MRLSGPTADYRNLCSVAVLHTSALPSSQVENSHYFEDAAMDDSPKRNVAATGNHHCSATA